MRIFFLISLLIANLISTPTMAMGEAFMSTMMMHHSAINTAHDCHSAASAKQQTQDHQSMDHARVAVDVCDNNAAAEQCKIQCELSACSATPFGLTTHFPLPAFANDAPAFSYLRFFPTKHQESLYRPPLIS
ncbi:hypothetical protein ACVFI8_16480 [Agarivorans sp. MS3-6]|uniref:hypothetical protein n=1 Tax=Agarivorans sp. TSD2052 TaxID=2937286 RepID=UPI00200F29FC|nr:hypothetical protein [Agarivorans sp. TSD2052]UPW17540.1 hypothetical protein M0C34_15020 [Agarivorans sp. TSD2052]